MNTDPLRGFRLLKATKIIEGRYAGRYRITLQYSEYLDPTALPLTVFAASDHPDDIRAALI